MKQMQGLDAAFVAFEARNAPIHIGSILIYDPSTAPGGAVRFEDFLAFIESRLQLAPVMRRRMVKTPLNIDYPYWVEDAEFDIEYHIRHAALPKPGDWRQLCTIAARNFARPLDLDRPPWEFLFVEGLDRIEGAPKGAYALLTKVHHAAIDGLSGIDIMHATHTMTPRPEPLDKPDNWRPRRPPSPIGLFARGYARAWTIPFRQAASAAKAAPGFARTAWGAARGAYNIADALKTPRTRFNDVVSPHRSVEGVTAPLKDIKALRALAEGATVNDVVLSVIGGAMRDYLIDVGELPDETLAAMAPISVRDEKEQGAMGNQVTAMRAPLGTHLEDPVARVAFVASETRKSKAMTRALGARQMTEISKLSPALLLGLGARAYSGWGLANRMKPVFNTVVTNVPGPPIPIYSCGARLVAMYGNLCVLDGVGLGHVVHSYTGAVTIGVTACREVMPDPEFYAACLRASFAAHQGALAKARAAA